MKGARSLTDEEIRNVFNTLTNKRDQCLFMVGIKGGLRISEILSLKLKNVMQFGEVANQLTVDKRNTKGKIESRTIPLSPSLKECLMDYVKTIGNLDPERPLFKSEQSKKSIGRVQAHGILKRAFNELKLAGKCSTHSLRKSYCHRVHKALGEKVEKTQVAMGHKNINSTISYLQVDREEVEKAILGLG